jgi:hypothetical protein
VPQLGLGLRAHGRQRGQHPPPHEVQRAAERLGVQQDVPPREQHVQCGVAHHTRRVGERGGVQHLLGAGVLVVVQVGHRVQTGVHVAGAQSLDDGGQAAVHRQFGDRPGGEVAHPR